MKWWSPSLKLIVAIALLGGALCWTGSSQLLSTLREIDVVFLVPFLLWSFLLIWVSVVKWRLFLRFYGSDETIARLFGLYLVGYFFSAFLPSHVGGDAVRSWKLGKKVGQREALSATVLERYTGLVSMLGTSCICVFLYPNVPPGIRVMVFGLFLLLSLMSCLAMSKRVLEQAGRLWERVLGFPLPFGSKFVTLQAGLRSVVHAPDTLFSGIFLSFVFFVLAVFNVMLAAYCVGWFDVPLLGLLAVLPIILVVGSLPITPSGLGVQEGAFLFFLQELGATPAQALAIALLLRAKWVLLALVGGIVWSSLDCKPVSQMEI
jgi:uncharacterized protein (TIRG00374 family)